MPKLGKEAAPKELPSPFLPLFPTTFPSTCFAHSRSPRYPISSRMWETLCSCPALRWNKTHHCPCFHKGTTHLWVFLTSHHLGSALQSPWAGVWLVQGDLQSHRRDEPGTQQLQPPPDPRDFKLSSGTEIAKLFKQKPKQFQPRFHPSCSPSHPTAGH